MVDRVVIAGKGGDAGAAAAAGTPLIGAETVVVTIQNGLGSADVVAAELRAAKLGAGTRGAGRLMVGIAGGFGASIRAPGHAHHNGMQTIRMGAYGGADGGFAFARVEQAVAVWRSEEHTSEPQSLMRT